MSRLDVYLHDELVGRLERLGQGRLRFSYTQGATPAQRLSLSLPVDGREFPDDACRPFFGGLLPEGDFLRAIARAFGVSATNAFDVLASIGGECAGAVSLAPPDGAPPADRPPRWLTKQELYELIASLPTRPLLSGEPEGGLRLSLAGVQDKLPVRLDAGRIGVTRGAPPSTHIIKLADSRYPDLVANEAFCMGIARQLGLEVAQVFPRVAEPIDLAGGLPSHEYLLVERYDRVQEDGTRRLHQEDLCQALGVVPEDKYEASGGPGVADCARLLHTHAAVPAIDLLTFRDALLVNFLIGNHDAHAKNFSVLLEGERSPKLAPLYDLISTAVYPGLSRKMAMKFGGEYRPAYVRGRHLDRLAADLGVNARALRRRCGELVEAIGEATTAAREGLPAEFADRKVLSKIEDVVSERTELLRKAVAEH